MSDMTIREALQWASSFLQEHNRESRVGILLLEYYTGLEGARLYMEEPRNLSGKEKDRFVKAVRTHAETGEPYQHIIGSAPFYGRTFRVSPDVLIPRQETEELMDFIRTHARPGETIADIGTGSGVLAVTLALETEAEVVATDISPEALSVARENAWNLGARVHFYEGSFLTPLEEKEIDILVSNPPYIAWEEKKDLDATVRDYDPELALFADNDGLSAYETICRELKGWRRKPRLVAFEIGYTQGAAVSRLFEEALPGYEVEVIKDLSGKDRIVKAVYK
ncbi:peptide chain release factor N(5)-glutamine methyltransferase [Salimicrobium flavidum]|nr:peptide chain release factor N(5)-glutamine methyltransferase [Salimicrobium flavidum]